MNEIRIRRQIATAGKKDYIDYAYQFVANNPDSGNINDAILEAFLLFYTPLGMYKYSDSQEEAIRIMRKFMSILQSHVDYLKDIIQQEAGRNISASASTTDSNFDSTDGIADGFSEVPASNGIQGNDTITNLSEKEESKMANKFFKQFNVD